MAKKILLVEDEPTIIEIYKTAFEAKGFEIDSAKLGETALQKLEEGPKPDIVLLDLVLPDMNGIDILKKMREKEETKDIYVFILTNYSSKEIREKGFDLKVEDYITKADHTPNEIVEIVKKKLKG